MAILGAERGIIDKVKVQRLEVFSYQQSKKPHLGNTDEKKEAAVASDKRQSHVLQILSYKLVVQAKTGEFSLMEDSKPA